MAIYTPSALYSDISGKLGNVVFMRNASGPALRAKVIPANPKTARQLAARAAISASGPAWTALTQPQRDAWETYASLTPIPGRLGRQVSVSGYDMYCRAYALARFAGVTTPAAAPTTSGLCAPSSVVTIAQTAGSDVLTVTLPSAEWWKSINGSALIARVHAPQAKTRTTSQMPKRSLLIAKGNSTTPPTGAIALTNPWGAVATGQVTYISLVVLDADGQISPETTYRIVAA